MADSQYGSVTWPQALAWRMHRQHLVERATSADLVAVVDRMCGLHAQVMSSVELALLARIDGLDRDAVRDALWRQRTLVKLWAMRKTLHVMPTASLGTWLGGLATFQQRADWLREPAMREMADLVGKALHGRVLTRAELAAEVARLGGSADDLMGSWGGLLKPASFFGRLCFAPSQGQLVRFTHPQTWLPTPPEHIAGADALRSIAGRFLGTYGPAAAADLAGWWGTNRVGAQQMLDALGPAATRIDVDGEQYWILREHEKELVTSEPRNVVRLLPGFDNWVVCAARRVGPKSRPGPGLPALDPVNRRRIYRLRGWVSPVLLVAGRMEGVWRHVRKGRQVHIEIERFRALPRWTRTPIEAEAVRIADYLGGPLSLSR